MPMWYTGRSLLGSSTDCHKRVWWNCPRQLLRKATWRGSLCRYRIMQKSPVTWVQGKIDGEVARFKSCSNQTQYASTANYIVNLSCLKQCYLFWTAYSIWRYCKLSWCTISGLEVICTCSFLVQKTVHKKGTLLAVIQHWEATHTRSVGIPPLMHRDYLESHSQE